MATNPYEGTQDAGWKKNLEGGYYSIFTGEKFNSKGAREAHDREWKVDYLKGKAEKNPSGTEAKLLATLPSYKSGKRNYTSSVNNQYFEILNSYNWRPTAVYSGNYGAKGSKKGDIAGYNISGGRVNYGSDWVGPDYEGANKNQNFRDLWTELSPPSRGIDKDEYKFIKKFLVSIKQGGTDLATMTKAETKKIIGVVKDFKKQWAKGKDKHGNKRQWGKNTYKEIDTLVRELGNTKEYSWLKTEVPSVGIDKEGGKVFEYRDFFSQGFENLDPTVAKKYESQFIDEFYGTTNQKVGTEGQGALQKGETTSRWGTDLVRRDVGFKVDLKSGTDDKLYKHLTRGKVNWAHYRMDKMFNKAARELGIDAKDITGKGDLAQTGKITYDNIADIRKVNDLINQDRNNPKADWKAWDHMDWTYSLSGSHSEVDDKGVMWSTDLTTGNKSRTITFTELTTPGSGYYIPPGKSKEFVVGKTADGEDIKETYDSPWTDMSKWVYDPDDHDQDKDHFTPSRGAKKIGGEDNPRFRAGYKVEARVKKKRDILDGKPPTIKGISWDDSGTPSLTSSVKKKTPPSIKPISTKSYA